MSIATDAAPDTMSMLPDPVVACERIAYDEGLCAGLAAALSGFAHLAPPGRVAALPTVQVAADARLPGHDLAEREGISFTLVDGGQGGAGPELTAFCARLGGVRLGLTRRLLEFSIRHLSNRVSAGEPTIRKQMVLGVVADVQTAIEAARRCLQVSSQIPAAVLAVHDEVTALDWEAAKLLGASGYVAGTPAGAAYVSRLVANCWLPSESAQ